MLNSLKQPGIGAYFRSEKPLKNGTKREAPQDASAADVPPPLAARVKTDSDVSQGFSSGIVSHQFLPAEVSAALLGDEAEEDEEILEEGALCVPTPVAIPGASPASRSVLCLSPSRGQRGFTLCDCALGGFVCTLLAERGDGMAAAPFLCG